jgi:methionyl-tRNA formyltransferase
LRVIFAGTPEFARVALERLHTAGHEILLVLTQPDRPAGRGLKLQASAVKTYALAHNLPVAQPRSLRLDGKFPEEAAAAKEAIQAAKADVMVVAAYGLILPQWVLDEMDCLNIHASLLPRWRGAAPIHRAIEAGDAETGVTIMQMDAGLDTGDMLLTHSLSIVHSGPQADTTGSLHDKLAALGGDLIVQALASAASNGLQPKPQPLAGITYAHKIDKSESAVDWSQDADVIERRIRAFNPTPGASTELGNDTFKLWRSEIHSYSRNVDEGYGTILLVNSAGIDVVCGSGVLRLTELQRAGGKRLGVSDLLRGAADLQPGARFGKLAA